MSFFTNAIKSLEGWIDLFDKEGYFWYILIGVIVIGVYFLFFR